MAEYEYDIFLSYSRADLAFAEEFVDVLRTAGLRVWFDHERILGGAPIKPAIAKAIPICRHLVVLYSARWSDSEWTEWEVSLFIDEQKSAGEDRKVIPILLDEADTGGLGPSLSRRNWIDWTGRDAASRAQVWQLWCSLGDLEVGLPRTWEERGRELVGDVPTAVRPQGPRDRQAITLLETRRDRSHDVLQCDRDSQWGSLVRHLDHPGHEAFFVLGDQFQAHDLFLERVYRFLPGGVPRRVRYINWPAEIPTTRSRFFQALADGLECGAEELSATAQRLLADQDLVLLHRPSAEEVFDGSSIVEYYTTWLPELIRDVERGRPRGSLKVVQGVAWVPTTRVKSALAHLCRRVGLSRPRWVRDAVREADAARALSKIGAGASDCLRIVPLEPLRNIGKQDVRSWCQMVGVTFEGEWVDSLVGGARTSAELLNRLSARLVARRVDA